MTRQVPVPIAHVRALEERAFNAWPALQTLVADGWLMRFADGYTKRANSVNAWHPTARLEDVLAYAGELYSARNLPLIVRVSPLAGAAADDMLAQRGFARIDETIVMTASLSALPCRRDPDVSVAETPASKWLGGFATANGVPAERRAVHDRMVALIPRPVAFAELARQDTPVAWGLGALERGMFGLFDIVTAPAARRQGASRRLVGHLLDWAANTGAGTAYLQVVATNAPAIALYQSIGFVETYRYHYRIAPPNSVDTQNI